MHDLGGLVVFLRMNQEDFKGRFAIIILRITYSKRNFMNVPIITQVSLKAGESLIKRTKQDTGGSFYMVGKQNYRNLSKIKGKPDWQFEGIDFIDELVHMSSTERTVVKFMKDEIRWDKELHSFTYIVELSPDSVHFNPDALDSIKYETFLKGFNLLHQKDLVRRVKRHHYMFNPEFLIITGEQASAFKLQWSQSKQCPK